MDSNRVWEAKAHHPPTQQGILPLRDLLTGSGEEGEQLLKKIPYLREEVLYI